jgi:murein DD-endopeptidase MepM/ murein hydrolase activator NlpD
MTGGRKKNEMNILALFFLAFGMIGIGFEGLNTPGLVFLDASAATQSQIPANKFSLPIKDALKRATKKPFGLKVSPGHSPVSPERFSGYHTGVDFETFASEKNIDVTIYAICDGKAIYRKYVNGYGGVFIQNCRINNADVTVLYGHLRLSSIVSGVGKNVKSGQKIGVLGKGYSAETSGERKHLHLGIHKGRNIVLLGYAKTKADLKNWIDARSLLK